LDAAITTYGKDALHETFRPRDVHAHVTLALVRQRHDSAVVCY
jgi:hypothetical protein